METETQKTILVVILVVGVAGGWMVMLALAYHALVELANNVKNWWKS